METPFEKWMFVLKNLHKLDRIPDKLRESIFEKLFMAAEIAKFSKKEHQHYEDSLKYYRDLKNSLDTAKEEGLIEGEQIGLQKGEQIGMQKGEQIGMQKGERIKAIEIAKNLKISGLSSDIISKATGLSNEEISAL